MPAIKVTRSININASPEKVFNTLNDFNHWRAWSPWLIQEPDAKVNVREDSKFQEWDGKNIGSGNITIVKEVENQSIDYDLVFLKPWKSKAKTTFNLSADGEGTKVNWTMDSSLPFFMFWMKKMMEAFVGFDYQRGLSMLKEYVEVGEVHSKLDFKGNSNFQGCDFIGIRTACTMEQMPDKMKADFDKLWAKIGEEPENVAGQPFTIYHKWDMVKGKVEYTSGVPVKNADGAGNGMISGSIPATPVHTVGHTGPYEYLGNVWSTMYNLHRNKVFKMNKKIDPFEVYVNNPMDTAPNDLVTEVHFATK